MWVTPASPRPALTPAAAQTSVVDQFVQYTRVEREISSLDAVMRHEGDDRATHPVFALARPTVAQVRPLPAPCACTLHPSHWTHRVSTQAALCIVLVLVLPTNPVASFPTAFLGPVNRVLALPFCGLGEVSAPAFALVAYSVLNALW